MAEVIWTEPALQDLDAIADYIALDDPQAARGLVQRVFQHVGQLVEHPESGSRPLEMPQSRYRQVIGGPLPCILPLRWVASICALRDAR